MRSIFAVAVRPHLSLAGEALVYDLSVVPVRSLADNKVQAFPICARPSLRRHHVLIRPSRPAAVVADDHSARPTHHDVCGQAS